METMTTPEVLTIAEIEAQYTPGWVLVGEPITDAKLQVLSGKVLHHGLNHDEVCLKMRDFTPGRFALLYLGPVPEDLVLVL